MSRWLFESTRRTESPRRDTCHQPLQPISCHRHSVSARSPSSRLSPLLAQLICRVVSPLYRLRRRLNHERNQRPRVMAKLTLLPPVAVRLTTREGTVKRLRLLDLLDPSTPMRLATRASCRACLDPHNESFTGPGPFPPYEFVKIRRIPDPKRLPSISPKGCDSYNHESTTPSGPPLILGLCRPRPVSDTHSRLKA